MSTNWGSQANSGVASGSNAYGAGVGTDYDITWLNDYSGSGSRYDGAAGTHLYVMDVPDTTGAVITLAAPQMISRVVLWFLQSDAGDETTDPGDATASTVSASLPVDFTVQTWNGSSWDTQATITGNTLAKVTANFTGVSTTKVRVVVTAESGGSALCAIQEMEVLDLAAPAVGSSTGTSTVSGVGTSTAPTAAGTAAGTSTVTGVSNVIVGAAAGTSAAAAVGLAVRSAVGSAVGASWAHSHTPYNTHVLTNLSAIGASAIHGEDVSGTWTVDGSAPGVIDGNQSAGYTLNDTLVLEHVYRLTLPSAVNVLGLRVRSQGLSVSDVIHSMRVFSAGDSVYSTTVPQGSMAYPPDSIDRATATYATPIYGTTVTATDILFQDTQLWDAVQNTQQLDLYINASYSPAGNKILELELITPATISLYKVSETANATSEVIIHHRNAWESTANATSTAGGDRALRLVSTANATSIAPSLRTDVLQLTSTADATSEVVGVVTAIAVSTADATSTAGGDHIAQVTETADATSTVVLSVTRTEVLVSTADATSEMEGHPAAILSSTANAVSTAIGTRHISLALESTANATSTVLASNAPSERVVSSANATSVVVLFSEQTERLTSEADCQSYVRLPSGALSSLFTNPSTMAAATWSGLPFNSMIEVNGVVYGAGAGGISRLVDDVDDDGTQIAAEVKWDLLDLGSTKVRPEGAYLAGTADGQLSVSVTNAKQGTYHYKTLQPSADEPETMRAPFGRGLEARYFRFGLTNPKGIAFSINDAQLQIYNPTRRS